MPKQVLLLLAGGKFSPLKHKIKIIKYVSMGIWRAACKEGEGTRSPQLLAARVHKLSARFHRALHG